MRGTRACIAVAIGILALAAAQTLAAPTVGVGSRIRFRTEATGERRITGKVLSVDQETLLIGETWVSGTRYDRASLKDVQVSAGDHRHAGAGLLAGAACGALLGAALIGSDAFLDIGAGTAAIAGALTGGLVGVAVGATIRHDEWLPVAPGDFRIGLGLTGAHGAVLSLTARF